MKRERFRCSFYLFNWIVGSILAFVVIGYWENGATATIEATIRGLWLIAALIGYAVYHTMVITMEIVDDRMFVNNRHRLSGSESIDISRLVLIWRVPALFMRTGQGRMQFYELSEKDEPRRLLVPEGNYSARDIKAFLTRIIEINPHVELHPQYRKLITGEIDVKEFKYYDLATNLIQAEREVSERLEDILGKDK